MVGKEGNEKNERHEQSDGIDQRKPSQKNRDREKNSRSKETVQQQLRVRAHAELREMDS